MLLLGGSRSGKTFLILRWLAIRAIRAPGSRHVVFRQRFNAIKASVVMDTWPKMMRLCFPGVPHTINKTDWYATIGESQIWFGGLDDGDRAEKILGMEFATIYFNEASQISYASVEMAKTRLAMVANLSGGGVLPNRIVFDCNPPKKGHWLYRLFIQHVDPVSKLPLKNPEQYAHAKINPADNIDNISADYMDTLRSMSARLQKRFLHGEFADETDNALFSDETIEKWRVDVAPKMVRVVVAVDPSGAGDEDNADNDAIGIVVTGIGEDGNAYVLEDCTVKAGPATWGRIAVEAFDRHQADLIVAEDNYGGAMVEHVIRTVRKLVPYQKVTATRGKSVRAEPFSSLYEQGRCRHVGVHRELEDELTAMTTYGYTGSDSPNRADSLIWSLAALFPKILNGALPVPEKPKHPEPGTIAWVYADNDEVKKSKYTSG